MKSFKDLAKERYSVREYKKEVVEPAKLDYVLETGLAAPTACNNQPQRIKVIVTPDDLAKADECTPCRFGAPAILLVCYDKNICWKRKFDSASSGEVDASIVTTHMMLAAHEIGLGTCWVMYFDPEKTATLFELPENIIPVAMLTIGYPADNSVPADLHSKSLDLESILLA